jgi:hypothetical protein
MKTSITIWRKIRNGLARLSKNSSTIPRHESQDTPETRRAWGEISLFRFGFRQELLNHASHMSGCQVIDGAGGKSSSKH